MIGYVDGWPWGMFSDNDGEMLLFGEPDETQRRFVNGFMFRVVEPERHRDAVVTIHHDGYLASGDAYRLYTVGETYRFQVREHCIGKLDFWHCSMEPAEQVEEGTGRGEPGE